MTPSRRVAIASAVAAGGLLTGAGAYLGLVTGAVPVDLGIGRRTRALGPLTVQIAAPREIVYGVIAAPYADRTTRALREKVRVLERGTDMVLAAYYTPISGRLRATTVETVRFARRIGSTSAWSADRCRMSPRPSSWTKTATAPCSSTPVNSAPTCGISAGCGATSSPPNGRQP
ncbi:hypothetical protein [Kribbella qitaiheensis]|uniref:hypothetical protein n=1 Tax=Kribbella qitaiheensis TaxID=1544730 RepID=UPI0019D5880B|nr:hypothetical protein [Kribbella qitaiheensis]